MYLPSARLGKWISNSQDLDCILSLSVSATFAPLRLENRTHATQRRRDRKDRGVFLDTRARRGSPDPAVGRTVVLQDLSRSSFIETFGRAKCGVGRPAHSAACCAQRVKKTRSCGFAVQRRVGKRLRDLRASVFQKGVRLWRAHRLRSTTPNQSSNHLAVGRPCAPSTGIMAPLIQLARSETR